MTSNEVLFYAIFAATVLAVAVGMVLAIGFSAHLGQRVDRSLFPWVFVAMIIAMIWTPIAGQRNLGSGQLEFLATAEEYGSALWLSRLLTLVVLFIVAARLLGWVFTENRRWPRGGGLFLALLLVPITHNFLAAAFGTHSTFSHNALYPLLLFTAAFVSARCEMERIIVFARNALFAFLLLGFLAAAVQPEIAIQRGYRSLIPGVAFRYWGLGIHANAVGPLAVLFILLAWHRPFTRRALQWLAIVTGMSSLVLTQSKTAWVGALLSLGAMGIAIAWPRLAGSWRNRQLTAGLALSIVLLGAAAIALFAVAIDPATGRAWRAFAGTDTGAQVTTLTGRIDIWVLALDDWRRSPVFGYGPSWGNLEYRLSIGNNAVVHAHNQFIHSLAAAGLVGLGATAIYLAISVRYALRGFVASRGLTAGLLAMVLVRAVTEVPLQIANWGGAEVFIQLLGFVVLIGYGAPQSNHASTGHAAVLGSRAKMAA